MGRQCVWLINVLLFCSKIAACEMSLRRYHQLQLVDCHREVKGTVVDFYSGSSYEVALRASLQSTISTRKLVN